MSMKQHWALHLEPLVRVINPDRVMAVGLDPALATGELLELCYSIGANLDLISSLRMQPYTLEQGEPPPGCSYYFKPSFHAFSEAAHPDVVLLDGDYNWATVYRELTILGRLATKRSKPFPVVLIQAVSWPYARRDCYENPSAVEEKQPYGYVGLVPGNSGNVPDGLYHQSANALREGGSCNGVLTAVEDFLSEGRLEHRLEIMPMFGGLGILIPHSRKTLALQSLISHFFSFTHMMKVAIALEENNMVVSARLAEANLRLSRRTSALQVARGRLVDAMTALKYKSD